MSDQTDQLEMPLASAMPRSPARRDFMKHSLVLAGGAAGVMGMPSVLYSDSGVEKITGELFVETFGGAYAEAMQQFVVQPFEKKYPGIKVHLSHFGSASEQAAKIQSGNARVDLSSFGDSRMYVAIKNNGLLPLRTENIPNFDQQHMKFRKPNYEVGDNNNYSTALVWGDRAIAYKTDRVKTPPTSWQALFNSEWEGRVALKSSGTAMVQFGALLTGQDFNHVTDLALIEAKLMELKPNLLKFWTSGSELTQLFATGEVWIADFWRGRVNSLAEEGIPIAYAVPEEGAPAWADLMVVPKSCGNRRAAEAFIDMTLDGQVQKDFVTQGVNYAPSNVHTPLSQSEMAWLGATPAIFDAAVFIDAAYQAKHIDEWNMIANRVKA